MKRLILAVAALALVGVTLAAQDYVFTNFAGGHVDKQLPPSPCGLTTLAAVPVVYDRSIWVFYQCSTGIHGGNGVVIARRFHHPNDNAIPPTASAPEPVPATPGGTIACPGGHRACVILPDGTYPLSWAETVVGR